MLAFLLARPVPASSASLSESDLLPLINRFETVFNDSAGMLIDPRYELNAPEVARLTVVSQALGYYDLLLATGQPSYRDPLRKRADFLIEQMEVIESQTVFDGMLAYALLAAADGTGDSTYSQAATPIIERLLQATPGSLILNWGLMAAMALAKHYELTGDPRSLDKTRAIIDALAGYQQADGSFPHYCPKSRDIHYTGWIGMELITIRHSFGYAPIDVMLGKLDAFLRTRVCRGGMTVYSEPCPDRPGCFTNYYSKATGCRQDYDTRGWMNELGYNALVFGHFGERHAAGVMTFLDSLTSNELFPDKWDYLPSSSDPIYPWATSNRSIIRASVAFWSLAAMVRDRVAPPPAPLPAVWPVIPAAPNPALAATLAEKAAARALDRWQWSEIDRLVLSGADMNDVCPPGDPLETRIASPATSDESEPRDCTEGGAPVVVAHSLRLSPNPVRDRIELAFFLSQGSRVELEVLDISGRRIRQWTWAGRPAGENHVSLDLHDGAGRNVRPGIYLIRFRAQYETTLKVVVQH